MQHGPIMQARAVYDYQASLDDPDELSFRKGDLFDIIDALGKWQWEVEAADHGRLGSQPPTPYNDTNESTSRNPKQGAHCPGDLIDDNGMGRSPSSKDMKRIFSELRRYMTIDRPMIILRSCHSAKGIHLTCRMIQEGGGR